MKWSATIQGEPSSKANQRRAVPGKTLSGRAFVRFIKSEPSLRYVESVEWQVPILPELLQGDLRFHATIYYGSRRKDLDASLILDALQGRVFKNDSQFTDIHILWRLDKGSPRAEVEIEELGSWEKGRKST